MRRTLIVTNDFPPRRGGIQSFVHELALRLDPGRLTVYAPRWEGDAAFDAAQPFEVVRHPTSLMIGGPGVRRRAADLARSRQAEVVIFGASAPLGLITPVLRKAGVKKAIAVTHGHEAGDRILKAVADSLAEITNDCCHVARHGGEEFVMLFEGVTVDGAWELLDEARLRLASRRFINRRNDKPFGLVTFSGGVADVFKYPNVRAALKAADDALYRAKHDGRNQIAVAH